MSVHKLEQNGLQVTFKDKRVIISKGNEIILEGKLQGNLYVVTLILKKKADLEIPVATISSDDQMLIHRRMGHSHKYPPPYLCEVCLKGKQTCLPYENVTEDRKAKHILEIVSTDICGPINPPTYCGKTYFITFTDHFSHFCICYLLAHKSEALEKFKE